VGDLIDAGGKSVKGKVYRACIQSVLEYASETWAVKVEYMARLERTEQKLCIPDKKVTMERYQEVMVALS